MDIIGLVIVIPAVLLLIAYIAGMVWLSKLLLPEMWDD